MMLFTGLIFGVILGSFATVIFLALMKEYVHDKEQGNDSLQGINYIGRHYDDAISSTTDLI